MEARRFSARAGILRPRSLLLAALLMAATGCSYMTIGAGEVGVLWTPAGVRDHVYEEGEYSISPFDKATVYTARSQEREERLEVLAANGLRIALETSIRYRIVPAEAVKLDRELGIEYYSILLGPTLRSQARRVVGRYQPEEIYSSQREVIEREIREGLEKVIQGRHVQLEAVLIRNVALPDTIQQAINNKLEAEQQSLKMKFIIEKSRQEAEQRLIESRAQVEREAIENEAQIAREKARAQAESEQAVIHARAAAEAKRIDAQATAEYEQVVQAHLTDQVLKLERIKAMDSLSRSPNSKVIFLDPKGAMPMLDLK